MTDTTARVETPAGTKAPSWQAWFLVGSVAFFLVTSFVAFFVIVGAIQHGQAAGARGRAQIEQDNRLVMSKGIAFREKMDEQRNTAQIARDEKLYRHITQIEHDLETNHRFAAGLARELARERAHHD